MQNKLINFDNSTDEIEAFKQGLESSRYMLAHGFNDQARDLLINLLGVTMKRIIELKNQNSQQTLIFKQLDAIYQSARELMASFQSYDQPPT